MEEIVDRVDVLVNLVRDRSRVIEKITMSFVNFLSLAFLLLTNYIVCFFIPLDRSRTQFTRSYLTGYGSFLCVHTPDDIIYTGGHDH